MSNQVAFLIGCATIPLVIALVLLRDWLRERRALRDAKRMAYLLMHRREDF